MLTKLDEPKKQAKSREKTLSTVQELFLETNASCIAGSNLIDCEAGIVFLEEIVKALQKFVELRRNSLPVHLIEVEKRIDELSAIYLEGYQKELQANIIAWGRRPYEEYIHERGVYE